MIKPNVIEHIERYSLDREKIEDLIKYGFLAGVFLDGKPGTAQRAEFSFDFGYCIPHVSVVVTTLEQEYTERG